MKQEIYGDEGDEMDKYIEFNISFISFIPVNFFCISLYFNLLEIPSSPKSLQFCRRKRDARKAEISPSVRRHRF